MSALEQLAEAIARSAHEGQCRKDGSPYIGHIESVVAQFEEGSDARIVAWLHDVIEDTETTAEDLRTAGVPMSVVEVVVRLTKSREQSYTDYIEQVKGSQLASKVKIADIASNLSEKPGKRQIVKFAKALIQLCGR